VNFFPKQGNISTETHRESLVNNRDFRTEKGLGRREEGKEEGKLFNSCQVSRVSDTEKILTSHQLAWWFWRMHASLVQEALILT